MRPSSTTDGCGNPLAADLEHILAHTETVWEELRGSRIFLTGGTGFFGCWLLESFAWACDRLELRAHATVLTRSPEAFQAKAPHLASHRAIQLVRGDVRSFDLPSSSYSHVIHGATEASAKLNREQPFLMLDTIVEGTRRVLDYARSCHVRRFLLISSGAVYGVQPPEMKHVSEEFRGGPDCIDPNSVYGEGKRQAELLAVLYTRAFGLESLIARCFAFVGPYLPLDAHFAIGNFIGDCLQGRTIEIHGDGTPRRSYLYAADLAIWLWKILVRGESCRPYNVGSERALSIAEMAACVAGAMESGPDIRIAGVARSDRPPERYVPDTGRALRELGLESWVALEDAIRRTAAWHRRAQTPHTEHFMATSSPGRRIL